MPELRDALLAKKRHESQFAVETVAYSGKIVARNGSVSVPGLYDHIWVMPYGEGEPEAVYNRRVKARPGLWVFVGFAAKSTILEVLAVDVTTSAGNEPTAFLELINHAASHRRFGDDPLWVERRMMIDGLHVTPAGGLNVRVSPGDWSTWTRPRTRWPWSTARLWLTCRQSARFGLRPRTGLTRRHIFCCILKRTLANRISTMPGCCGGELGGSASTTAKGTRRL
jgi:hypothetical protein